MKKMPKTVCFSKTSFQKLEKLPKCKTLTWLMLLISVSTLFAEYSTVTSLNLVFSITGMLYVLSVLQAVPVWETEFLKHWPEKQISIYNICSTQNSTCPGQFSTHPAQNALTLASVKISLIESVPKFMLNANFPPKYRTNIQFTEIGFPESLWVTSHCIICDIQCNTFCTSALWNLPLICPYNNKFGSGKTSSPPSAAYTWVSG